MRAECCCSSTVIEIPKARQSCVTTTLWATCLRATKSVARKPSPIYDLAAAWPEREINELIGVTFEGLDCSERLFLPDNMAEEMKGQILVTPLEELRKANGLGPEDS